MPVYRFFIESIDLRALGKSSEGSDLVGDSFDRPSVTSCEKQFGPFSGEGPCDSATHRAAGSVDYRCFILQNHVWIPRAFGHTHLLCMTRRASKTHRCLPTIFSLSRSCGGAGLSRT